LKAKTSPLASISIAQGEFGGSAGYSISEGLGVLRNFKAQFDLIPYLARVLINRDW
jgi:hypothetical protein